MIPIFCLMAFVPEKSMFLKLIILLIGLLYAYLGFTNIAKRIWHITGDKMKGIWLTIGLIVFAAIPVLGSICAPIITLALLFIPGKEA